PATSPWFRRLKKRPPISPPISPPTGGESEREGSDETNATAPGGARGGWPGIDGHGRRRARGRDRERGGRVLDPWPQDQPDRDPEERHGSALRAPGLPGSGHLGGGGQGTAADRRGPDQLHQPGASRPGHQGRPRDDRAAAAVLGPGRLERPA